MTAPLDHGLALLADPTLPAQTLADLAAQHRELWPQIAAHPNVYPGLIEWMMAQGFVPATPTAAPYAQPQPQVGAPAPKRRRTGLIVGIAAAVVVIIALAITLPLVLGGKGGGNVQAALRNFEKPRGEFSLRIIDGAGLEASLGTPFPGDGTDSEILDWLEQLADEDSPVQTYALPSDPEQAKFLMEGGGFAAMYDGRTSVATLLRSVNPAWLDGYLGSSDNGVWYDEDYFGAFTLFDGTAYFAPDEEELPAQRPSADRSLASDEAVVRVLQQLQQLDHAHMYSITNSDYLTDQLEDAADTRADRIRMAGMSIGVRADDPIVRLVYDFGTSAKAAANLQAVTDALETSADSAGVDPATAVRTSGSLVVAEFTLRPEDVYRYPDWLFSFDY